MTDKERILKGCTKLTKIIDLYVMTMKRIRNECLEFSDDYNDEYAGWAELVDNAFAMAQNISLEEIDEGVC